jgi:hypothetical protein
LRNIYQPPAGSSGNIVGHATAWAKEEEEKTSLSSPSFFFSFKKRRRRKKNLQVLLQLRKLLYSFAVVSAAAL